jgi:capsid protein
MPTPTKAQLAADLALWKGRAERVRSEYDVLRSNKLRRTPTRETTGEGGIYTPTKRAHGTNVGRELERNYSNARGIVHQFRMNVVGALGKLQVNAKGGTEAAAWFNGTWAKDCDFRDAQHWSTVLQNVVAAALREGDVLAVFDDGLIEDSGKLLFWESDQVLPCSDALFKAKFPADGHVQDGGIVRDKWGRIAAYTCTGKRGLTVIDAEADLTIWQRDNAILPRDPWRMNQGRGVPPMLTAAASLLDLYEMLARELQTAKLAAGQYAHVKRADAVDDWDAPGTKPELLPENSGKAADTVTAETGGGATAPARNYDSLEAFTGGYTDYGQPGDDVQLFDPKRPNVHMAEFIEAVLCHAGAAFGLARAYACLRADTSYTAFRGDMIMSWQGAFFPMQKWLERAFADRVAVKALTWAQRKGMIAALPAGWEQSLSWRWPKMPEVQADTAQNAVALALKNATTDFAQEIGPDWRQHFDALAEQIAYAREKGIPLSNLETKAGAPQPGPSGEDDAEADDDAGQTTEAGEGLESWL